MQFFARDHGWPIGCQRKSIATKYSSIPSQPFIISTFVWCLHNTSNFKPSLRRCCFCFIANNYSMAFAKIVAQRNKRSNSNTNKRYWCNGIWRAKFFGCIFCKYTWFWNKGAKQQWVSWLSSIKIASIVAPRQKEDNRLLKAMPGLSWDKHAWTMHKEKIPKSTDMDHRKCEFNDFDWHSPSSSAPAKTTLSKCDRKRITTICLTAASSIVFLESVYSLQAAGRFTRLGNFAVYREVVLWLGGQKLSAGWWWFRQGRTN